MDKYVNVRNIAAERERTFKSTFVRWESLLVLMFIAVNVMNVCISPNYLKADNLFTAISNFLVKGFIAFPMAFILVIGEIDLSVGATVALYAVFLACYFLLSVLHSASKFIFICALSLALGAARLLLWRLFAVLQGFPDDPAEAMRIGCMQACYLPCAWLLLSSLRRPRQRHDDRQEED